MIPATGKPKTEIARLLGISRQHLYDLLEQRKPLTAPMAVRIAKAFGGSAASWLRMQAAHDGWHAEREMDVSRIPVIKQA